MVCDSDFQSHIQISVYTKEIPNGAENEFLSIVQAVTEVFNKAHFSLQMGNCPIPVAEDSGQRLITLAKMFLITWGHY